jgi:hypothetical protein
MKSAILILAFLCVYNFINCQIRATTKDGQKVILYDDFTWKYADYEDNTDNFSGITKIEVGSDGMVGVEFRVNGQKMSFFDGKVFFGNMQPVEIDYNTNSFFAKSLGKIKQISFSTISVSFEYHENSIFEKSEGKIKSIQLGNQSYTFEYHENSYFEKSVGKLKRISCGRNSIEFEYHENTLFPETEGKLKEITGEIPGIKVKYLN